MALFLLKQPLLKSNKFSVMLMISKTTTLPISNKWIVHCHVSDVSIVAVLMVSIIAKNVLTKPTLLLTKLCFKRIEIVNKVMVTVEQEVLAVAKIVKVIEIMSRTSVEWRTLPALLMVDSLF